MSNIEKIKSYWMATMATGETREQMEEIWRNPVGMADLMGWFNEELELGLTEEEMDEAIAAVENAEHEWPNRWWEPGAEDVPKVLPEDQWLPDNEELPFE